MEVDGVLAQFPAQLADGFQERQGFDVAHRSADFRDDEVKLVFFAHQLDVALDFVRDVGNDLYGLAQIVALAFLFDDALVYPSGSDVVGPRGLECPSAPSVHVELKKLKLKKRRK